MTASGSGSHGRSGGSGQVALCEVRETALSVDEVLGAVRDPGCGAVALFVGVVRDHDAGTAVVSLDYSAHPLAEEFLRRVCEEAAARDGVARVAAVHRTGALDVGDTAVVVAVAGPHRQPALAACRELIDTLKATVPIWKHQRFADGTDEWVGLP